MITRVSIEPLAAPPDADVVVPGSKSITNRALICAALARGTSVLEGALVADDTSAMLDCLRAVGVDARTEETGVMTVRGLGGRIGPASDALNARLSGTTARFIGPVVAAAGSGEYRLDATSPMRRRPMEPMIDALRSAGATIDDRANPGHLPLTILGGATGGTVQVPGHISSQFLSGLLLAGPAFADGLSVDLTSDLVSVPYVGLTKAVMRSFGIEVVDTRRGYRVARAVYESTRYRVEPDASAAAYFFAAAAITGGRVRVPHLGRDALQGDTAFVDVLERMGAEVHRATDSIEVRGSGRLRGIDVDLRDISDTAQTLAAVAVFADSPTRVTGIGFIRRKETDRLAAVVAELRRMGIEASEDEDGFTIQPGQPHPASIKTYDDHRMAMSFALVGLRSPGIEIEDPACVDKTYPDFFADLERLRSPMPGR